VTDKYILEDINYSDLCRKFKIFSKDVLNEKEDPIFFEENYDELL
jgi:hypothetical protein